MNPSLVTRLDELCERFSELAAELADPDVVSDNDRFRRYSQEYSQLEPVVQSFERYRELQTELGQLRGMADDQDADIREMARAELDSTEAELGELEQNLKLQLVPKDPLDERNIFLEVRAGTGGDEAALFAGDLFAMYERYATTQGWQVEILSANAGEHGGYKEIISRVAGQGAYSRLKFESGTHRVQRVPATESQGRIHTSACTVAVLPELDEVEDTELESKDLRIDTYRASGAGGQHVNKTDSAVRITHLPTGIVVECQEERSQHKNRARAMGLLKARLLDSERERQTSEQAESRRQMVGSGDRSERIRTYNFPQGRVTDHRINLTLYKLEAILDGDLDQLVQPLTQEQQAAQLSELGV